MTNVPLSELTSRMTRFRACMDAECPEWELAAFFGRINQYYFTGTMQDGLLLVPRHGEAVLWVRRSIERARAESLFPDIRPMKVSATRCRPAAPTWQTIHLERELVRSRWCCVFENIFRAARWPRSMRRSRACVRSRARTSWRR
jgi:Xaa-Pro aminopeptidase